MFSRTERIDDSSRLIDTIDATTIAELELLPPDDNESEHVDGS